MTLSGKPQMSRSSIPIAIETRLTTGPFVFFGKALTGSASYLAGGGRDTSGNAAWAVQDTAEGTRGNAAVFRTQ